MRKKLYFTVAALGVGMILLAGCGDTKNNNASVNNTEAAAGESQKVFDYDVNDYVTLGEYKNLAVRYPTPTVSEDDVKMEAEYLVEENTQYNEIPDRAIQDGDYVNIDYAGTIGGQEFEGGSDQGFEFTLGQDEFIDEFEQNLIGKKAGEEFTFKMTFPEDYDKEIGGKEAEFKVTVNSVSEIVVPEYNDAFVKEVTDYDTVKAYEEALADELMAGAQQESASTAGEEALQIAVANATINGYPQTLYDACYDSRMKEYQDYADMLGMEVSEFIGEEGELEAEILEWVNEILVSQAIAEKEGFSDLEKIFAEDGEEMASDYGYESLDSFVEDYGEAYVKANLVQEKAMDFLYENAKVEEVSEEEYYSDDGEAMGEVTDTEAVLESSTE